MAAAASLVSRSILLSRQSTITTRRLLLPTTNSSFLTPATSTDQNISRKYAASYFFSTSPDYTNYETWHKDNYEDAEQHENILSNTNVLSSSSSSSSSLLPNQPEANPDGPRTSVLMELTDRVGALHDVLRFL